jgi:hypothetical protein
MTKRIKDVPIKTSEEVLESIKAESESVEELKQQIARLEELLANARKKNAKSHEEEIIMAELKRMWTVHVVKDVPMFETNDVKKLKTLVEALNIIRNGFKEVKPKEKDMSVEDALRLVSGDEAE